MKIIDLDISHATVIASLHEEAFEETWSAQEFCDLIGMPAAFGFLMTEGDLPVGFILCQGDDLEAEIITIASAQSARRCGVGSQLLNACGERANRLFLEVAEDNPVALSFYENHSFKTVGKRSKYYKRKDGRAVDALVMERVFL